MEEVVHQGTLTDPLLACCLCGRLLQEAVQLTCLHNCCRQCLSTAASTGDSRSVACGSCDTVSQVGSEQPNGFIDSQVLRCKLLAEFRFCGKCRENGEHDKQAVVWCPACLQSLCEDCVALHRQYFKQHMTRSLNELRSLDEVLSQESPAACPIHKKPMDIACRNCELAKCVTCWAECNEKKHEMHVVGKDSFDTYVGQFVTCISTMEIELFRKAEVLEQPKTILLDLKAARDCHLEDLKTRKRRVVDAVEMVYQEIEFSTKKAYDDLEAEGHAAATAANRIAADLSDARNYIHRLVKSNDKCEILKQQKSVRERLNVLSTHVDTLSDRLTTTMKEVKIEYSLPEDFEKVLRGWIGMPRVYAASSSPPPSPQCLDEQQRQFFCYDAAIASVQLPVECQDVALTIDGRSLLLAAGQHGLIEFCSSSGRELSHWLPPEQHSGQDDEVSVVAAVSKGRAAVSLRHAMLILLLTQREQGKCSSYRPPAAAAAAGDAWTEERRVQLTWRPGCLSVHGVLLAVCNSADSRLRLMNLNSGRRLSAELPCENNILSLAVVAGVFVTGSCSQKQVLTPAMWMKPVKVNVLDARSLPYGQPLWRHELSSSDDRGVEPTEELQGLSADASGCCLYAAMQRNNRSGGRVTALSLVDGSELRRVVLSFDSPGSLGSATQRLLPVRLSLCEDSAAVAEQQSSSQARSSSGRALLLAVLCWDSATKQCKTVTVHRSTCDMP